MTFIGHQKLNHHSLQLELSLLSSPRPTDREILGSFAFQPWNYFQGAGATPTKFNFLLLPVASTETPLRKSSEQASAVMHAAGRTKGFDSQQSYTPFIYFFMVKERGGGWRLPNRLHI